MFCGFWFFVCSFVLLGFQNWLGGASALPSVDVKDGLNLADLKLQQVKLSPTSRRKAVDGLHENALAFAVEGKGKSTKTKETFF
jgi:hypothetical protein